MISNKDLDKGIRIHLAAKAFITIFHAFIHCELHIVELGV
jgi:hypothetical protein